MAFGLGAGFVFCPTDRDLLKKFLKLKVNGEVLNCGFVVEKQIYGPLSNPWDVLDDSSTPWVISGDSQKTTYVFTRLNTGSTLLRSSSVINKSSSGGVWRRKPNIRRRAGCGSWNGRTARSIMDDNNKTVLGTKREMIFQINDITLATRHKVDLNQIAHYRLHEYVLSDCYDYALCKITLDTSKTTMVVCQDVSDITRSMQNLSCSHVLGNTNLYGQEVSDITRSMKNLSCSHVLGKRKPFEAQDLCSGPSKMICM